MENFVMPGSKEVFKKKKRKRNSDSDMFEGHRSQVKALMANTETVVGGNRILPQTPEKGISWTHS